MGGRDACYAHQSVAAMTTDPFCALWALVLTIAAVIAVSVDDRDLAISIRNVSVLTLLLLYVFDSFVNAWPFIVPAFAASFRRQ